LSTKRQLKFIKSGHLKNPYKDNGDMVCKLFNQENDLLISDKEVWVKLADDEFLPAVIEKIEKFNSRHLVRFKNVKSADDAILFQHGEILIEKEIDENIINDADPINYMGFEVLNESKQKIGFVKDTFEIPGNPLLMIEMDEKEVMVPIAEEFIQLFDIENRKIIVRQIDELLGL